jgi:hypothetical protein
VVERSDTTGNQIQKLSHPEWVPDEKETWASKEGQVSLICLVLFFGEVQVQELNSITSVW